MDFRTVFFVIGILLTTLAVMMVVPAVFDLLAGYSDWEVFFVSGGVTLFVGVAMALTFRSGSMHLGLRQAFVMTTLSWLVLTFFAALPLHFSNLDMSFTDAFFEAMSGLTTTGSTVITGLDDAPPGILIWREILQGTLVRDSQVQCFLSVLVVLIMMTTIWLWQGNEIPLEQAVRLATVNLVSIMTGTGYVTDDYSLWGSFALPIFFFIMFIGGCAGSTTCGIKVFRFQVLYASARTQIHHLLQPHGVFIPYYNRRPISDDVITSVLSFFFMWFLAFSLLALGLGFLGLDFLTAFSSAATAIANVGPALGPSTGPAQTFQHLPDAAKWLLSFGMLLGRLELFTVIVLFTRSFWRG